MVSNWIETSGRWKQMRLEASYWPVVHFTWILLTTVRSSSVFSTWEKQVWQPWLLARYWCVASAQWEVLIPGTHSSCLSDILKISIFFLILNSSTVFERFLKSEHFSKEFFNKKLCYHHTYQMFFEGERKPWLDYHEWLFSTLMVWRDKDIAILIRLSRSIPSQ